MSDSGAVFADKGPIRFDEIGITGQAILLYWARQQPDLNESGSPWLVTVRAGACF